jgi:selenocysteine lyase/cysteine desulfurase
MGLLWGTDPSRIAFLGTAAEGMAWPARGLDWREGDNVVTTNLEFPSVAYAWKNLRRLGVEVRMVGHRNWLVREEDLLDAVDRRTRLLAVSQVSFYTGQNLDIPRLREGTEAKGTLFAVDATHASGVLPVRAELADLTVSSSYKWMLGTHGTAPCHVSHRMEAQTAETCFGWRNLEVWPPQEAERHPDADLKPMPERMEPGNPAMLVIMHLNKSLETILSVGIDRIEAHARDLSELAGEGLEKSGFTVISPRERERRSGNTCFLAKDARGLQISLEKKGILTWGEFGRMRISTHLHNGSADVERLLNALR